MMSVRLLLCMFVGRITAEVISRFHWNLVSWLGLSLGRND